MRRLAVLTVLVASLAYADEDEQLERDLKALQAPQAPTEESLRALVATTLPRVSKVMGVREPSKVKVKLVSRDAARTLLLRMVARDYPGDVLARLGEALGAVGLAAKGDDFARLVPDFYSQHVAGFYDPHEHTLFLLEGLPYETQALVIAHELAHVLQDEAMQLETAITARSASEDAQLALAAAIEGQAQATASEVMSAQLHESGVDLAGMADLISDTAAGSASEAANSAPTPWLGLQLAFPYAAGAKLIGALRKPADPVVRGLLKRPPASTAQVLDPALYSSDERPKQAVFDLGRVLPGSKPTYATTLGRANLDLFGALHADGKLLGEGWRGDRLEVVRLDGKTVAVWAITWAQGAQAERAAKAFSAVFEGAAAAITDGSRYEVVREGSTVLLLDNVPAARLAAVRAAALGAFK